MLTNLTQSLVPNLKVKTTVNSAVKELEPKKPHITTPEDEVQFSGNPLKAKQRRLKRFLKKHAVIKKVELTSEGTQFIDERPLFKVYLPRSSYEAATTALKTKWLKENEAAMYPHFRSQFEGINIEFEIIA